MQSATVLLLAFVAVAVVAAEGQFYVPRAYYTIDAEGHASPPVPLRRLRRSYNPYPYGSSANANANAEANSYGGNANANAIAIARANGGGGGGGSAPGAGWGLPSFGSYGSSNPDYGLTRRQAGAIYGGRSVTASSSVGLDAATGQGYYDQYTNVH